MKLRALSGGVRVQTSCDVLCRASLVCSLLVAVGVLPGGASVARAGAGLTNGLVVHYTFDGDTGTNVWDSSGNGNHARVIGGVTSETGITGQGARFHSRDTYLVCDSPALNMDGWSNVTVAACVKLKNYTTYGSVVVRSDAFASAVGHYMNLHVGGVYGGQWAYNGGFAATTSDGNHFSVYSETFGAGVSPWPEQERWYHICGTFDGSNACFYVDGVLDASLVVVTPPLAMRDDAGASLMIGKGGGTRFNWYDDYLDGVVDQVRVYNRVLGSNEVAELYEWDVRPTPDITSGLLLHYTFDNDQGTNVIDSSGSGFDGTAYGAVSTSNAVSGLGRGFDGVDDYIGVPHDSGYKPTGALTVSVWLNFDAMAQTRSAISCTESSGYSIGYSGTSGLLQFAAQVSGGWIRATVPGWKVGFEQWHHVVGTYDGANICLYLDGESVDSSPASGAIRYVANALMVGAEAGGGSTPGAGMRFDGCMDEVRIYGRGLASNEVAWLYERNAQAIPDAGNDLVLYYPFDDDQEDTVVDASGFGFDGTAHGAVLTSNAVRGLARRFDGLDDYVGTPHNPAYKPTEALTVSAWLNFDNLDQVRGAVSCTENSGYSIGTEGSQGVLQFAVYLPSGWARATIPTGAVAPLRWHHVVGTYDGASANLYLDGVLVDTSPAAGAIRYVANSLIVGGEAGTGSTPASGMRFDGCLDEVRIYRRGLSSNEVAELCARDLPDLERGLVAYYPFNGNANDESGNGNHAAVHGATYTNAGCTGGGYDFDGINDYIDLGDATKQTGPFTLSMWFTYELGANRRVSLYGGGGLDTNVDRNGIAISRYTDDRLFFDLYTGSHRHAVWLQRSENDYMDGKWHHVVCTYDGQRMGMFVDGVLTDWGWRDVGPVTVNWSWVEHYLGRRAEGGGSSLDWYWQGKMDEVRIYDRGLSMAEILELYRRDVPPVPDITSDLVLHYTFDTDQGCSVVDSSGFGFDGTAHGTTLIPDTAEGYARCFDGVDDYVGVPHESGYKPTAALTVSAWVRFESKTSQTVLLSCSEAAGWNINYKPESDRLTFAVYRSQGISYVSVGGDRIGAGKWCHLVGTYDGSVTRLYLDGDPVDSDPGSGTIRYAANDLIVGGEAGLGSVPADGWFLHGCMDDVRIYNRALATNDVTALYAETMDLMRESLFLDVTSQVTVDTAWDFNWQTGTFFADVTVSNNADSMKRLIEPYWYVVATTDMTRLRFPDGVETNSGHPYADISEQVIAALPSAGNGDVVLDPGESVTATNIEFISRDRCIPEGYVIAVWADPPGSVAAASVVALDADHDGIPDAWEDRFLSLDRSDPNDAGRDADEDGMDNYREWVAGTNPEDATSVLALRHVTAGRDCRLRWRSEEDRLYTVYRSVDLAAGFEVVATNIASSPPVNEFVDRVPPSEGAVFYRVGVRMAQGGANHE